MRKRERKKKRKIKTEREKRMTEMEIELAAQKGTESLMEFGGKKVYIKNCHNHFFMISQEKNIMHPTYAKILTGIFFFCPEEDRK